MARDPTFRGTAIRAQFEALADAISEEVTVYLIGGGALTLTDLKPATKDIDLVVRSPTVLKHLHESLLAAGYREEVELGEEYEELSAAFIVQNDRGHRFDVFNQQVAGVLRLTDGMVERSEPVLEAGPLHVRRVSHEDIFLFKSVANRRDDVSDMEVLAATGLDFDIIESEMYAQIELLSDDAFLGAIVGKLEKLEERGVTIPAFGQTVQALQQRATTASDVFAHVRTKYEMEYAADDLYEGVPVKRVVQTLEMEEETVLAALEWLEQLGELRRAGDCVVPVRDE